MKNNNKEIRDQKIIDLHNSGESIGAISSALGMSKGGIHKVLQKYLDKGEVAPKKTVDVKLELTGKEERFTSFVGYERVNVNVYAHKETGEVVKVAYVKADDPKNMESFGYFVKLND